MLFQYQFLWGRLELEKVCLGWVQMANDLFMTQSLKFMIAGGLLLYKEILKCETELCHAD